MTVIKCAIQRASEEETDPAAQIICPYFSYYSFKMKGVQHEHIHLYCPIFF